MADRRCAYASNKHFTQPCDVEVFDGKQQWWVSPRYFVDGRSLYACRRHAVERSMMGGLAFVREPRRRVRA